MNQPGTVTPKQIRILGPNELNGIKQERQDVESDFENEQSEEDIETVRIGYLCVEEPGQREFREPNDGKFTFILDNISRKHMVNDPFLARNFTPCPPKAIGSIAIDAAKGSLKARSSGDLVMVTGMGVKVPLKDVLYSPDLPCNMISIRREEMGFCGVGFLPEGIKIWNEKNELILSDMEKDHLPAFQGNPPLLPFVRMRLDKTSSD